MDDIADPPGRVGMAAVMEPAIDEPKKEELLEETELLH